MKNKPYQTRSAVTASLAVAVFLALMPATSNVRAATLNVDTNAQCSDQPCTGDDGQTGCSLGEAIVAINQGADVGPCANAVSDPYGANDTINLPAGQTLGLQFWDHFDVYGPTGLPAISKSVTIHGHGSTLTRSSVLIGDDIGRQPDPMRLFEIASPFDLFPEGNYNDLFTGDALLVNWDDTTFTNGNPGCGRYQFDVEKYPYDGLLERIPVRTRAVDIFEPCHSGGAGLIRGTATYVTFDKTTFKDNQVELHRPYKSPMGGAVFVDGGAFGMTNITDSVFTGNKAPAGGALYTGTGVQVVVSGSTFADNEAQVLDDNDQPWTEGTADGKAGGAVFAEGPALTVNGSAFFRNHGGIAGAIAVRGETASMLNSTFFDNVAEFIGGAVATVPVPYNYRDLYGPAVQNSYNTYVDDSGFFHYYQDAFARFGSAPDANLQHLTVVGNTAGAGPESMPAVSTGGGIANLGAGVVTLKSLILTGNAVGTGGSGPNCYGAFVSYGTNDMNFPTSDGTCVAILAAGAPADMSLDPVLKACNPDTTTAGLASCDPETTSPILASALNCPSEDQHHAGREPEKCTVGAIELTPEPATLEGILCGNGQVNPGEECDEGESRNSNEPNATCRTDCTLRRCGDGIVDTLSDEGCEPDLDPLNCRSDCTIDLCFQVKADALLVGSGEMTLAQYLDKYEINPNSGCSPHPEVNQCQPLASLGGPGSDNVDFTVQNAACLTTADGGGCSLAPQAGDGTKTGVWAAFALSGLLMGLRGFRVVKKTYLDMRS